VGVTPWRFKSSPRYQIQTPDARLDLSIASGVFLKFTFLLQQ